MTHVGFQGRLLLVGSLMLLALPNAHGQTTSTAPMGRASLARVPLHFERNAGQVAGEYRYIARGQGYSIGLTDREAAITLKGASENGAVRMRVVGGSAVQPVGQGQLSGRANYLRGADPKAWITNVPTFQRIVYRSIYKGIDLVFYGNQTRMQYDFVVAPGVDARQIRVAYDGATDVATSAKGELIVRLPEGMLRQAKPYAYQNIDGKQAPVAAGFIVDADNTVRFKIGAYDRSRPLVIDPVVFPDLDWSTFAGGLGSDGAQSVAVDGAGNVYVTGWTNSGDYPTTGGAYDTSTNGFYDIVVTKLAPDGTSILYSTYVGGSGGDFPSGIAMRGSNAVVVGDSDSPDFPVTAGVVQSVKSGGVDGVVFELNASGSALVASTYIGGTGYESPRGVALDPANNRVCVAGWTQSPNYPTTVGAYQTTWPGGLPSSAFVTALNNNLQTFSYSTYLHGSAQENYGTALAVDATGQVVIVGRTNSVTFPTTVGAFQTANAGESDAFVTMFNVSGSALVWSTLYGGEWTDGADAVVIDPAGNVCIAGRADSNNLPMLGAFQAANNGYKDVFFAAFQPGGATLLCSTYLGGSNDDLTSTLVRDSSGFMYISGETSSANFPTTAGAYQVARSGSSDAFIAKLYPTLGGVTLEYASYLGGTGDEAATGAATDGSAVYVVSGWTTSSDYPTTAGVVDPSYSGGTEDGFVTKFRIGKLATTMYTIDRTGIMGEKTYLRAYDLRRTADNVYLVGETVTFKIDGSPVGTGVTNAGGDANYLYTIASGPLTRTITAEYAGNSEYLPCSHSATLTAQFWGTKQAGFPRTQRIAGTTELKARLVRTDNVPVAGKTIDFYVDGTFVISRVTDATGYAKFASYVVPTGAGAGVRPILSDFIGDIGYGPSSKTANLTVQPAVAYIWVGPKTITYNGLLKMYAYFRRQPDLLPQTGKTVDFKIDGTTVATVVTDASGVARYNHLSTESVGLHTMRCEFAGDLFVDAGYGEGVLTINP